jgi:hypothetical protein
MSTALQWHLCACRSSCWQLQEAQVLAVEQQLMFLRAPGLPTYM